MMEFLKNNWGTILVGLIVAGIVLTIIIKIIRDKKKGKCTGCGCSCENCPGKSNRDLK